MDFSTVSLLRQAMDIVLVAGVIGILLWVGERAFGFDIKGAFDAMESAAAIYIESKGRDGAIWPVSLVVIVSIVCATIIIGL